MLVNDASEACAGASVSLAELAGGSFGPSSARVEEDGDVGAARWLDGTTARLLVLQFADDHHAFHEDAKPGDLSLQKL